MRVRRAVLFTMLLSSLSVSGAGAFVLLVTDPAITLKNAALNAIKDEILQLYTDEVRQFRRMARRLSVFTDLAKYAIPDPPRWRTRRIDDPLPQTLAYMDSLNAGDGSGQGYEGVARARVTLGDEFAGLGEDNPVAENAIRSALATIDLADSTIIAGTDQTGRIRGSRRSELNAIAALEEDVIDPSDTQSTTAVLDKVSGAELIRAGQQQTRLGLLTSIAEQLLVDNKRARDTEAAAMNMQLGRLIDARSVAASTVAGSAEALRTWRQP